KRTGGTERTRPWRQHTMACSAAAIDPLNPPVFPRKGFESGGVLVARAATSAPPGSARGGVPVTPFKKILAPTDFSPAAAEAFRTAVALAKTDGGEVIVAHITQAPAVVVENGQVTPGDAAGKPTNLWNMFRTLVSDEPGVHVTHEVVVAGRVSAAG